jgi:hypothetical protein
MENNNDDDELPLVVDVLDQNSAGQTTAVNDR